MFHFMRANSTCKINLGGDTQYSALLCLNKGNNNNKKRWTLPNLSDNNTSVKQSSDVLKKMTKDQNTSLLKAKAQPHLPVPKIAVRLLEYTSVLWVDPNLQ